ncbi:MAG: DUF4177 domain-containing protein [Candidatus Hydrogenedentes bacterium]|nr:DUF4177 domain-containing protein [Candidatus Hydrogenedentota bacterium]
MKRQGCRFYGVDELRNENGGMRMEWEYYTLKFKLGGFLSPKIEPDKIDTALNEAGSQGWDLVNAVAVTQSYGAVSELIFFFKRQR